MELRVCCVSQLHQHRRVGSQHVVQASGVECQTESCRAFSVRVEGDGGDAQNTQHDHITELAIHQQQPESQQLPVAALASTEPNEGGAAGLTQL
jgi:hypothetical protein